MPPPASAAHSQPTPEDGSRRRRTARPSVHVTTALPAEPADSFWNDDLEIGVDYALRPMLTDESMQDWIQRLSQRQLDIIFPLLVRKDTGPNKRKLALLAESKRLRPFVLVRYFSTKVHREAVRALAEQLLPPEILQACKREDADTYDKNALLFALYCRGPHLLKQAFYFNLVERHGMARLALQKAPRQPKHTVADVFTRKRVAELLAASDRHINDEESCELRDVIPQKDGIYVFLRRGRGITHVLKNGGGVFHGPRPEWIVLHIDSTCKHVRIISDSCRAPHAIATIFAAAFFEVDPLTLTFDNEREACFTKEIQGFLAGLIGQPVGELVLVEATVANAPIEGRSTITITNPSAQAFAASVTQLDGIANRPLLQRIADIKGITVQFRNKRLALALSRETADEDEFVLRYGEHRLSGGERLAFESFMKDTHGLPVYPAEKRSATSAA